MPTRTKVATLIAACVCTFISHAAAADNNTAAIASISWTFGSTEKSPITLGIASGISHPNGQFHPLAQAQWTLAPSNNAALKNNASGKSIGITVGLIAAGIAATAYLLSEALEEALRCTASAATPGDNSCNTDDNNGDSDDDNDDSNNNGGLLN